jgi:hypothetical protein
MYGESHVMSDVCPSFLERPKTFCGRLPTTRKAPSIPTQPTTMAANRALLRTATRSFTSSIARTNVAARGRIPALQAVHTAPPLAGRSIHPRLCLAPQRRWQSSAPAGDAHKLYDYAKVKSLVSSPSPTRILIGTSTPSATPPTQS